MMSPFLPWLALLCSCVTACGSTSVVLDGTPTPRVTLEFHGQPYRIHHVNAHPRPGGASSGLREQGGSISGQVCGANVDFTLKHEADHLQLIGFVDGEYDAQLQVRDRHGERSITGAIATKVIDLRLRSDSIYGYVGRAPFHLALRGDSLVGGWHIERFNQVGVSLVVHGRNALWEMPAGDQAVVLPLLLSCLAQPVREGRFATPPTVGFGGEATALPPGTLLFRRR